MNAERDVTIDSLGAAGDGIAHDSAGAHYVPFALPGETVRVRTTDKRRFELVGVLAASPHRIAPFCPHAGRCGGCRLQHADAATYGAFKRGLVEAALRRAAVPMPGDLSLIDAHGAGRRRIFLHVLRLGRAYGAGFMAVGSHRLEPIESCPAAAEALRPAPAIARAIGEALKARKPFDVQVTATDTGLDIDLRGVRATDPLVLSDLADVARGHDVARLTIDGDPVAVLREPVVSMGRARVALPPASFLQATAAGEEALAARVTAGLASSSRVADLFCGVGPFALRLAETAAVTAWDAARPAVAALDQAHRRTSGLKPLVATARDLFRHPVTAVELKSFDGAVFDPPRQGAEAQAHELARSPLSRVVAVSCDPQTFARDAAILVAQGFVLDDVVAVDQFKWTSHVEIVARFTR
ncbi:MAG: RNA methyltransferase [Hyphomicrobiales bacterium]